MGSEARIEPDGVFGEAPAGFRTGCPDLRGFPEMVPRVIRVRVCAVRECPAGYPYALLGDIPRVFRTGYSRMPL